MAEKKNEAALEVTKALIGCGGGIAAACVTGMFALIALFGQKLPVLNPVSPGDSATATSAISGKVSGSFGPMIFAAGVTADKKPIEAGVRFPQGVTLIYAIYPYSGMVKNMPWRDEWYLNGQLQEHLTSNSVWSGDEQGTDYVGVSEPAGLEPGQWQVRLYIADKLVQQGNFTVEKRELGVPFFGPLRFAEDVNNGKPVRPHQPDESFVSGIRSVYAFFDAGNMTQGLKYKVEWYRDGALLSNVTSSAAWNASANKIDSWARYYNEDSALNSGTYTVKLYIEGKLVQLGTFVIEE